MATLERLLGRKLSNAYAEAMQFRNRVPATLPSFSRAKHVQKVAWPKPILLRRTQRREKTELARGHDGEALRLQDRGMRLVGLFTIALLLALNPGLVSAAPPSQADYDALVAVTRSVMMEEPAKALQQARQAHQFALAMAQGREAAMDVARAEWLEGEALSRLDRAGEALPLLEHAIGTVSRIAPHDRLYGDLLLSRGWLRESSGAIAAALEDFQVAFNLYRGAGEARGQAKALQNIAGIYQDAGDHLRAERYYSQAAEVYRGDPAFALAAHNNVGESLRQLGRYADAQKEFELAFSAARTLGSPLLEANILTNLASTKLQRGNASGATILAHRALKLVAAPEAADERPFVWGVLAQIANAQGHAHDAAELLTRTFDGVDLDHSSLQYRDFHKLAADVYARTGQPGLAVVHIRAWKRLDDDVRAVAASTNASLMAARFDFSTQNLRIVQLQANRARMHETVLIIVAAAVSLISGLLLVGLVSLRRSRNDIRATNGRLTKALQAKSDFLAMTSHEIRTPLNGILGMTQVILADRRITDPLRSKIQTVHGAGETMRALVDDILDLSKMETGKLSILRRPVRLGRLIADIAKLWTDKAQAKGLSLTLDLAAAPDLIEEDEGRLRQILFNLLSNAVKFTERGGINVVAKTDGDEIVISIADTGIGVAPEHQNLIFEKFQQADGSISRRFAGTGLGLAICRNLAEAMGGRIELSSRLGEGANFTLRLPLRILEAPVEQVKTPLVKGDPCRLAEQRVVLLEPNRLTQRIIAKALSDHVGTVTLVDEMAAVFNELKVGDLRHVVIQAGGLGSGGQDLAEVFAELAAAASAAEARVIVLVGAADQVDASALTAHGFVLLHKPVSPSEMLAAMDGQPLCAATALAPAV